MMKISFNRDLIILSVIEALILISSFYYVDALKG